MSGIGRVAGGVVVFLVSTTVGLHCLAQEVEVENPTTVANSNPYSFGGACASQGAWTRTALDATHQLMKIVSDLRDDGRCRGFKEKLSLIGQETEKYLAARDAASSEKSERLWNLPNEISALKSFSESEPGSKADILRLLMDKNLENASLSSELAQGPLANLLSLKKRAGRTTSRGLELVDVIANQLPTLDQCLLNSENNMAMVFGASMQLLSAFVSSGNGFSKRLADTLLTLAKTMRERKYSEILARLNQSDLWTSMSCIIETTSESWCTVRDMQTLFYEGVNELQPQSIKGKTEFNNPFQGYYLLVQEVPLITSWLQTIQIGVEPRLNSDASFQTGILDTINEHLKKVKLLQGAYNFALETLGTYKKEDLNKKKVKVLELMGTLVTTMTNNNNTSQQNFFLAGYPETKLPFLLLGEDIIPNGVSGGQRIAGSPYIEWDKYLLNGGNFVDRKKFDDPDELAKEIGTAMRSLIEDANSLAIAYFNKWFIVDKPTLVNRSVMDTRYSVIESLGHINQYLTNLDASISKDYPEASALIPQIVDTQNRIRKVLAAYDSVSKLGMRKPTDPKLLDAYLLEIPEAYEKVVETVYHEFNVLLQRAGFISNRMQMFVYADYAMKVRKNIDMPQYQREIYIAAGHNIMERLVQLYSGNPALVLNDLQTAKTLNKRALEEVEKLVHDSFHHSMEELNLTAQGKKPSNFGLAWNSFMNVLRDTNIPRHYPGKPWYELETKTQFEKDHPVRGFINRIPGLNVLNWWYPIWFHPDLYPMRTAFSSNRTYRSGDDEFHSAGQVVARLCAQTLAFNDWMFYSDVCENKVLSGFIPAKDIVDLGVSLGAQQSINNYKLQVNYNQKAYENLENVRSMPDGEQKFKQYALNEASRVCAYRDYARRNHIVWLILQELKNRH